MERSPTKSPGQQVRESVTESEARQKEGTGAEDHVANQAPSGSTLLNLCLADDASGGWPLGRVVNLIGDSSSGKTLLALTSLAEMAANARFDDYKFILDDAEDALAFDVAHLFGSRLADRLDTSVRSDTVESFYGTIMSLCTTGEPFIYVLDSLDALSSVDELKRAETYAEGKEVGGSYKMDKPKLLSEILRVITGAVARTNSLVIIISQTRDNLDPFSFQKKTRSGGRALKFYCSHEVWLTLGAKITSKERTIGAKVIAKVTKNKSTGKIRDCEFCVYYDYGVDDIGSCIDFLVSEGAWQKKGNTITTSWVSDKGAPICGMKDKLTRWIEAESMERELRKEVHFQWDLIERALKLNRKPRFE